MWHNETSLSISFSMNMKSLEVFLEVHMLRRRQLLRGSGKVNEVHSVFLQQKPVTIFHMKESLPLWFTANPMTHVSFYMKNHQSSPRITPCLADICGQGSEKIFFPINSLCSMHLEESRAHRISKGWECPRKSMQTTWACKQMEQESHAPLPGDKEGQWDWNPHNHGALPFFLINKAGSFICSLV